MSSPGRRSAAQTREQLLGLLAPVVEANGHDLEDVTVSAAGRRSVIRVVVDADGGVDLDAVAEVSRAISEVLDADDGAGAGAFAGPYVLEVTSPGTDRPLTEPRHWRRNIGRLVDTTVEEQAVSGRIVDVTDAAVTLEVGDVTRDVAWGDLGAGRIQVEFSRTEG